jgi:predicted chitinase
MSCFLHLLEGAMVAVEFSQIESLAPRMRGEYRAAFSGSAQAILQKYGIAETSSRVAHFFAQTLAETGGYRVLVESLDYSATRLTQVWPKRFPTPEAAAPYAHNEEKLGEKVYNGRMGNDQSGDGFRYRGRGLLQITGKSAYKKFGDRLGVDLVGHPELVFAAAYCLEIAASEWATSGHGGKNCNELADADDIEGVTRAINGGLIGIDDRRLWLKKTKAVWPEGGVAFSGASRAFANLDAGRELASLENADASVSGTGLIAEGGFNFTPSGGATSSRGSVARLIELASDVHGLNNAQTIAARRLLEYDGDVYPTNGCAITLSVLMQEAGFDVPNIYQAIEMGRFLERHGWSRVPVGKQKKGDIGSTCGEAAHHGTDHIYLVLNALNADEMVVADNQEKTPHFRFASGRGRSRTTFFLRAVDPGA